MEGFRSLLSALFKGTIQALLIIRRPGIGKGISPRSKTRIGGDAPSPAPTHDATPASAAGSAIGFGTSNRY